MINYLEGKALEKFQDWAREKGYCESIMGSFSMKTGSYYSVFSLYPISMQFGLIQEWADSEDYILVIDIDVDMFECWIYPLDNTGEGWSGFKTRQEAQEQAVKKLNEIYNGNI